MLAINSKVFCWVLILLFLMSIGFSVNIWLQMGSLNSYLTNKHTEIETLDQRVKDLEDAFR